jgi:Malic enzyme, NAD binding domain
LRGACCCAERDTSDRGKHGSAEVHVSGSRRGWNWHWRASLGGDLQAEWQKHRGSAAALPVSGQQGTPPTAFASSCVGPGDVRQLSCGSSHEALLLQGLVCRSRDNLQQHKLLFAHDIAFAPTLLAAVRKYRPTALVGVSTIASSFSQPIIEAMAQQNERPLIFPLSNPTDKSECTFEEAMMWSRGRALFASGSPFDALTWQGQTFVPAQANNAYVFPALGHAAILARAQQLPQAVFLLVAEVLSTLSPDEALLTGHLFPPFGEIIPTSKKIIVKLCEYFEETGLGLRPAGHTWEQVVENDMWAPPHSPGTISRM